MATKKKKDYTAAVRKVNKGQKSCKKIAAVHAMVESLIKNDSDEAAEHLHTYLQMTAREILLGEKADEDDDKEEKDDKPKKGKKGENPFAKKEDKDDDDEDDDSEGDDDGSKEHEEKESEKEEKEEDDKD